MGGWRQNDAGYIRNPIDVTVAKEISMETHRSGITFLRRGSAPSNLTHALVSTSAQEHEFSTTTSQVYTIKKSSLYH